LYLGIAVRSCGRADIMRAAKHIGLWTEDGPITDLPGAAEMLSDVALFEPNQRGRRAYDHFLSKRATQFGTAERALAEGMAGAFFSLFRNVGPHEAAGIWLEDLLAHDRRLWLMDETLEVTATDGMTFGMRVFDAGPFHAGFGIAAPVDAETIELCRHVWSHQGRLPFRHSLAATVYGDTLWPSLPPGEEQMQIIEALLEHFDADSRSGRSRPAGGKRAAR
jgi:hypothetical protein